MRYIFLLVWFMSFTVPLHAATKIAPLQKGTMDATGFTPNDIYLLKGEWSYFPNEILQPTTVIHDTSGVMGRAHTIVPGTGFTDGPDALMKSAYGYASYLLKLDQLPSDHWALWGLSAWTSSRVYVFDSKGKGVERPVIELGRFSDVLTETLPALNSRMIGTFQTEAQETYYILVQVANQHHSWGGMWTPPTLAHYKKALDVYSSNERINYLLIGISGFVSFFALAMFLRRRSDLASLALFFFAGERTLRNFWWANYGFDWLQNLSASFELDYKLVWLFWMPSSIFMLIFFRAAFPRQMSRRTIDLFALASGLPYIYVLLTPVKVHFAFIKPYYSLLIPLVGIVCIRVIYKALKEREEGAQWLLAGACCLLLGAMLDVAYTYDAFMTTYNNLTGIGIVAFLVCQSQIISHRSARAFIQAEHLSKELKTEVDRQTRDIRSILATIKQGIFSIHATKDPIDPQYSLYLEQIVGVQDVGAKTLDKLFLERTQLTSDEKAQILSCLDASLKEDQLVFELNQGNLPQAVDYQCPDGTVKTIEIDWAPILLADKSTEKVLVNLRDVTEVKRLQAKSQQQEEDLKILVELVNIPEDRFHRFIKKALDYLGQNRQLLQGSDVAKPEILKQLFMNMHTIKGTARTYLLRAIANASHEAENRYSLIQEGKFSWEEHLLLQDIDRIERLIQHYREVGEEKLGWQLSDRIIKLPAKTLENVMQNLNHISEDYLNPKQKSQLNAARSLLFNYGFVRLQDVIDEACRGLDSIARDLEKPNPRIEVDAPIIVMKNDGVNILHGILIHLLRNSLDHGIEVPDQRKKRGKKDEGTIYVRCQTSETFLTLSFYDDGKGLDLEAIRLRAIEKGLLASGSEASPKEIAQFVFEAGLSTKPGVSDISGRGVGLSAVKQFVTEAGGAVRLLLASVEDPHAVKFHFEIDLPSKYWLPIDASTADHEQFEKSAS